MRNRTIKDTVAIEAKNTDPHILTLEWQEINIAVPYFAATFVPEQPIYSIEELHSSIARKYNISVNDITIFPNPDASLTITIPSIVIKDKFDSNKSAKPSVLNFFKKSTPSSHWSSERDLLGLNYLSIDYQKSGVQRFKHFIQEKLESFCNKSSPCTSLQDIRNQLTSDAKEATDQTFVNTLGNLAQAALQEFTQSTNYFLESLETKLTNKTLQENNVELLAYLQFISCHFQSAQIILKTMCEQMQKPIHHTNVKDKLLFSIGRKPCGAPLQNVFEKIISFCKTQYEYLTKAVDIQMYQISILEDEWKKLQKESTSFFYEGRAVATGKTTGGSVLALTSMALISGEIVFFPVLIADFAYTRGTLFTVFNVGMRTGAELVKEGVKRMGYACQKNFSPYCIEGRVNPTDFTLDLKNPNFQQPAGNVTKIYILYGGNPSDIFQKGTDYHRSDEENIYKKGCILAFVSPVLAKHCASLRMDGSFHDPVLGWRIYDEWTDKEREQTRNRSQQIRETISHTTKIYEIGVLKTIMEYMDSAPCETNILKNKV